MNAAKMNSAATIDGTPARMSTMKLVSLASRPRPYSTRKTAAMMPIGTAITAAMKRLDQRAVDRVVDAAGERPPAARPRASGTTSRPRRSRSIPAADTVTSTHTSGTRATGKPGPPGPSPGCS